MKYVLRAAEFLCCFGISLLIACGIHTLVTHKDRSETRLDQERQQQYQAWTKLYHREDLTFEEWNTLRMGNFLDDYHGERTQNNH